MTKANKTIIKDKILDLREKIQQQSKDLHKQIEQKNKRYENLLDKSQEPNSAAVMTGVYSLIFIFIHHSPFSSFFLSIIFLFV